MGKRRSEFLGWSSIVATVATVVLAVTALITVYITVSAWRAERESARPYFTLKDSPKVQLTPEVNFEFKFTNAGVHPAVNLHSKSLVFDQSLAKEPVHQDEFDLVNEIPKDTSSSLLITIDKKDINPGQLNINPHFIVIDLQYDDPIIKKKYNQTIFLKWNGVLNGQLQAIVHLRLEEKEKILAYLKEKQIDPKARK